MPRFFSMFHIFQVNNDQNLLDSTYKFSRSPYFSHICFYVIFQNFVQSITPIPIVLHIKGREMLILITNTPKQISNRKQTKPSHVVCPRTNIRSLKILPTNCNFAIIPTYQYWLGIKAQDYLQYFQTFPVIMKSSFFYTTQLPRYEYTHLKTKIKNKLKN